MSKWVKDTERAGRAFSMIPEAVRKLTSDSADFHRIDSGRLKPGARADPFVIDPTKFDDSIEEVLEVPMGEFPGFVVWCVATTIRSGRSWSTAGWHGPATDRKPISVGLTTTYGPRSRLARSLTSASRLLPEVASAVVQGQRVDAEGAGTIGPHGTTTGERLSVRSTRTSIECDLLENDLRRAVGTLD
jgi:hypothetical protein